MYHRYSIINKILVLMIEILHNLINENHPKPWSCGSIVYVGSCRI